MTAALSHFFKSLLNPRLMIFPALLGLLLFAASLTPSLIPRTWAVQGVLGGMIAAIGYVIGYLALSFWRLLELPEPREQAAKWMSIIIAIPVGLILLWCIFQAYGWQNSIRSAVSMEPVKGSHTLKIIALALIIFAILMIIGRLMHMLFAFIRDHLLRFIPPRAAGLLGFILAAVILLSFTRKGVVTVIMNKLDNSYTNAQHLFDKAPPIPADNPQFDVNATLLDWQAMGKRGRDFISQGPSRADIAQFWGAGHHDAVKIPIRVYVGRAEAASPQARAQLALDELIRRRAFDRKILIVASPTGTGWLDPAAHDPLDYMHKGDIASVAVQYSYLQSPLAMMFETEAGLDQAQATINLIYDYWRQLPPDQRPRLYMSGISLGAWSSMYGFDIFRTIDDPINGALWAGPPFPSQLWQRAVNARQADSPYVLPKVGHGRLVRFVNQYNNVDEALAAWSRIRVVFLQYASDPIVFYQPSTLWKAPTWMREPPAPDVSPKLRFIPVVTQFQLALDMAVAKSVPQGFGHNYKAEHYIGPWAAVSQPHDWTPDLEKRLKHHCTLDITLGCERKALH